MAKKFTPKPLLFLTLTIFSAMIFSLCFQDTINYDEFFSMQWSRLGWKEMMETLIADVHPPLYYILLKAVLDLTGQSLFLQDYFQRYSEWHCCGLAACFWNAILERKRLFSIPFLFI